MASMSTRYEAVLETCEPYLVASFLGAAAQPRPGPPGQSADLSVTIARFAQRTWMKTIRSALTSLQLGYETEPRGNGIRRVAG